MRSWNACIISKYLSVISPSNIRPKRTIWKLCGAVVLGLSLAAAQLTPMLELMRVSTREHMTPSIANRFVFDLSHLETLIWPTAFGSPAHGDYFGGGNAWEPGIFIGWLPLAAILYVALTCHKSARVRFWLITASVSLWLSTGTAGGLFWLAFYVVPGLANFHDPARFLFITTLSMCVLTAIGIDSWQRARGRLPRSGVLAAIIVTAIPLILFGREWNPTTSISLDPKPSHIHAPMAGRSYLPAHDLYWRRFVTDGYSDYGPESNVRVILNTDTPNVQMREGIETAAGYEPVPVAGPAEVDGLTRIAIRRGEPTMVSLMRLMDVTDLMLPDFRVLYSDDFTKVDWPKRVRSEESDEEVNGLVRRAWITPAAIHIEGKSRAESAIAGPEFDPVSTAIVSGMNATERLRMPEHVTVRSVQMRDVRIESRTTTSVIMITDAAKEPGFLVYSGACYPGWKAWLDGKPATLYCTDVAFMGLEVPAGSHRILLYYSPDALQLGIYVFAIAVMAFLALVTYQIIIRSALRTGSKNANICDDPSLEPRPASTSGISVEVV